MVLNLVWLGFFVVSFLIALVQLAQGQVDVFARLLSALFDAARTGFDISLGLTGIMALWLGILRIGEKAGLIALLARMVTPMFRHLFPGVPSGHAAQGAMTMNLSANLLGLDNAATPLGLKAMQELQHLNPRPDTATNAQILFIVLNTAGLTLIPTSVIAIRQTLALKQGLVGFNAADIFLPTLVATSVSLLAALLMVAAVQRLPLWRLAVWLPIVLFGAGLGALTWWLAQWPAAQASRFVGALGAGIIFGLVVLFLVAGAVRRVPVYDTFVEGAREGFQVAVQIIPYLVAMLGAVSVFRASGALDWIMQGIGAGVAALGLPVDFLPALPVGLMKVLSGSGARGLMVDVMQTYGVGSFPAQVAAIIQGSTETTFYVLAVYFGSVGVRNTRHALACALFADAVGIVAAVCVGYAFFHRA